MRVNTPLTDNLSDLRLRMGYPPNAPFLATLLALMPSLSVMVLLRHHLGVRMVGAPRLAMLLIALVLWGLPVSLILEDELRTADDWWRPMLLFSLTVLVVGGLHRIKRWTSRLQGERLNTLSLGVSWLSAFLPQNTAERYADPLFCIGIGAALCAWPPDAPFMILGVWLILAGITLYGIEKYVHEIQLDQNDDLLNAEAHQFIVQGTLNPTTTNTAPPAPPVATGIDPALAAAIAKRQQTQPVALPKADVPGLPAALSAQVAVSVRLPPEAPLVAAAEASTETPHASEEPMTTNPVSASQAATEGSPASAVRTVPRADVTSGAKGPPIPPDRGAIAALVFVGILVLAFGAHQQMKWSATARAPAAQGGAPASTSENTEQLIAQVRAIYNGGSPGLDERRRAVRLLTRAAELGHPLAQYAVGSATVRGEEGLPRDPVQGVAWLERAAAQRMPEALYSLGKVYSVGHDPIAPDEAKAARYFGEAAALDHAGAQHALGIMHLGGLGGLPRDHQEAVRLIVLAYRKGDMDARKSVQTLIESARKGHSGTAALLQLNGIDWRAEVLPNS